MTSALFIQLLIAFGIGYLLGSVPFGLLLTRAAGLGDVRKIGSGNIGATNVLRTGNKKLAAATLLLDGLKGTAAVLLVGFVVAPWLVAGFSGGELGSIPNPANPIEGAFGPMARQLLVIELMMMTAGLGAFTGHTYPVWLGFKGGKGVATYIGVLIALLPKAALVFCGLWLAVAAATRYSSLAALVAAVVTPLAAFWLTGHMTLAVLLALMTLLLFWKHRENISRLLSGSESKIGAKAKSQPAGDRSDAPA